MEEELIGIKNSAISLILESPDLKNLEEVKLQFLGRSGKLTLAIKGIAKLPEDRRPEIGALANEVKQTLENAIDQKAKDLKGGEILKRKGKIDVTNPAILPPLGHLH